MKRTGSLLIVALVAVAVVAMLAVALAAWLRVQATGLEANRYRRQVRRGTLNAAALCLAERLATDTNGWDALDEPWAREPWERREEGWILRVSGTGWSDEPGRTTGLVDETGKAPLNAADVPLLTALILETAEAPIADAPLLASRIVDWRDADETTADGRPEEAVHGTREMPWKAPNRPFTCVEELGEALGAWPQVALRLAPLLTVHGEELVNINTAPEPVLRALLVAHAAGDEPAALRLLARILTHRRAGQVFTAGEMAAVGRALGGLPADEAALLGRAGHVLSAASTAFGGVAEAVPAEAWAQGRRGGRAQFVWDRRNGAFTRWVEE